MKPPNKHNTVQNNITNTIIVMQQLLLRCTSNTNQVLGKHTRQQIQLFWSAAVIHRTA